MRIECINGYFKIYETKVGQVSNFIRRTGMELTMVNDYYTFEALVDALDYSIIDQPYLGVNALKTFEGSPEEIFLENELVYDLIKGKVVKLSEISMRNDLKIGYNRFVATGFVQPGSIDSEGNKVLSYNCFYSYKRAIWLYSGVKYV